MSDTRDYWGKIAVFLASLMEGPIWEDAEAREGRHSGSPIWITGFHVFSAGVSGWPLK